METYSKPSEDTRLANLEDRLAKELERKRHAEQDLQKRKDHLRRIERSIREMQAKRKELIGEKILSLGCQTPEDLQALCAAVTQKQAMTHPQEPATEGGAS